MGDPSWEEPITKFPSPQSSQGKYNKTNYSQQQFPFSSLHVLKSARSKIEKSWRMLLGLDKSCTQDVFPPRQLYKVYCLATSFKFALRS